MRPYEEEEVWEVAVFLVHFGVFGVFFHRAGRLVVQIVDCGDSGIVLVDD